MSFLALYVVFTAFLGFGTVTAQNKSIADTPSCALTCIAEGLAAVGQTNFTFQEILCPNVTFQAELSVCVQKSCNFSDQIVASEVEATLCLGYPKESRSTGIIILIAVLSAIVFPIAGLKFYTRWVTAHGLEWDDYAALVATILLAAIGAIELASAKLGLGEHYWTVQADKGIIILKLYFVAQMIYVFIQVSAKISLLLLYVRVFPRTRTALLSKLGIAFLAIHGALYFFLVVFQCTPVSAVWNKNISGKCLNLTAIGFSGAAASIAEDFFILVIPIFDVIKLQLGKSKKWSLIIMFSIGSLACITSIIRLGFLSKFSNSFDSTWDQTDVVMWSLIEEYSAVMCACLPSLRNWIRTTFHTITTGVTSSNNASGLRKGSQRLDNGGESNDFYALQDVKHPAGIVSNSELMDRSNRF